MEKKALKATARENIYVMGFTSEIVEGAYLSGFEPSSDSLSFETLFAEAENFLIESMKL